MAVENIIKSRENQLNEDFEEIYSALNRSFSIISNLKKFSEGHMKLEPVNLKDMVQGTLQLMKTALYQIQVHNDVSNRIQVMCPRGLVQQVLFNLIYNSCQAMKFKGNLKFNAYVQTHGVKLFY